MSASLRTGAERVLFVKANQLGDSVVNLPVVEGLVDRLGGAQVGIVTTPIARELYGRLVPEKNLLVMTRSEFNGAWRDPRRLIRIARWIHGFRPDRVLVPSDQGYVARMLARLFRPGKVMEMENPLVNFPHCGTHWVSLDRAKNMHRNDWELFRSFAHVHRWEGVPELPPRPYKTWGFESGSGPGAGKVLIHPGSSRKATRWDERHFVSLAERIAAEGIEVLWMDESEIRPRAQANLSILERKPLLEFARSAAECGLFIGNNSGPMHLCDALNVPLLILCGPVGFDWDPYWSTRRELIRTPELDCQPCEAWGTRVEDCPRINEPFACMSRVTLDLVFRKAMDMLSLSPS